MPATALASKARKRESRRTCDEGPPPRLATEYADALFDGASWYMVGGSCRQPTNGRSKLSDGLLEKSRLRSAGTCLRGMILNLCGFSSRIATVVCIFLTASSHTFGERNREDDGVRHELDLLAMLNADDAECNV